MDILKKYYSNLAISKPRKDTCKTCDIFKTQLTEKNIAEEQRIEITREKEIHQLKAQYCYDLPQTLVTKCVRK